MSVLQKEANQGQDREAVIVAVNDSQNAYNKTTGKIALSEGDNLIKVCVTSYDGTTNGIYTFKVKRTQCSYIERFDGDTVPEV